MNYFVIRGITTESRDGIVTKLKLTIICFKNNKQYNIRCLCFNKMFIGSCLTEHVGTVPENKVVADIFLTILNTKNQHF